MLGQYQPTSESNYVFAAVLGPALVTDIRTLLAGREVSLLRATIREDMSMSMVDELMKDILRAVGHLDHHFTFSDTQVLACSDDEITSWPVCRLSAWGDLPARWQ